MQFSLSKGDKAVNDKESVTTSQPYFHKVYKCDDAKLDLKYAQKYLRRRATKFKFNYLPSKCKGASAI